MNNKIIEISPADGTLENSFVGLRVKDNKIIFKYPECFHFELSDKESIQKQILKIMNTFSYTKQSNIEDEFLTKNTEKSDLSLYSLMWILRDYLIYHGYINREKRVDFNAKGKINWKKTISQIPFIQGKSFIFPKTATFVYKKVDNRISDIYKYCVSVAIKLIGWLMNIQIDDYLSSRSLPYDQNLFISIVKEELSKTFDDVKKCRLNHMLNILTGTSDNVMLNKEFNFGVDNYYNIFESLVKKFVCNVDSLKDYYPKGEWKIFEDKNITSSSLRPDALYRNVDKKELFVFDAKYYSFGNTFNSKDLPNTDSIQKQITYLEFIKNNVLPDYKIFNCFILPYDKKSGKKYSSNGKTYELKNNIEYFAQAFGKRKKGDKTINSVIVSVFVDLEFLINNSFENFEEELNNLLDLVRNNSEVNYD